MPGTNGGPIFAEGHVPDVMDGIFDGPVTPAGDLDLSRAQLSGRAAGEEKFGFFGHAQGLEMMGRADNDGGLGGMREASGLGSHFEGIDLPRFMPAVSLAQSDVRREKRRPLGPGKGGRVSGRAWVDWL